MFSGGLRSHLCMAAHLFNAEDAPQMSTTEQSNQARSPLLALSLGVVYLGFVVWLYATQPLLLVAFAAVLVLICVREYGLRLLRAIAPARVRNRSWFTP